MGANPTQALGVLLVMVAFTLIALGLAVNMSILAILLGLAALAGAIGLFLKCKPWEYRED